MKLLKYCKLFARDFAIYIKDKLILNKKAAILMYHSIGRNPEFFTVKPDDFDWQMRYLRDHDYNVISLAALVDMLKNKKPIPPKTVAITFDDGYEDNYTNAFPVLKRYNFPATFFVVTGRVGDKGYTNKRGAKLPMLDWGQIREMHSSGHIDFQPHTVTHPKLDRLELAGAEEEISRSKQTLEDELGKHCELFAYPQGRYNHQLSELARKYFSAVATIADGFVGKNSNVFELPRNAINFLIGRACFKLKI